MTDTETNRQLITNAFEGLRVGDHGSFMALFAEDMVWEAQGSSTWSRRAEGRAAMEAETAGPLFSRLEGPFLNIPELIIADGDKVVVTARGDATTVDGKRYCNGYCFIFTMRDGMIVHVREYFDGILADAVLGPHPLA